MGVSPGRVRRARRRRDVRLRRRWRRRQRRDHQPRCARIRPGLVRAAAARGPHRIRPAHDHGARAVGESVRPAFQRAAFGQPGRYRRRRAERHCHWQDVLFAPQTEPAVGCRRRRLLVQAGPHQGWRRLDSLLRRRRHGHRPATDRGRREQRQAARHHRRRHEGCPRAAARAHERQPRRVGEIATQTGAGGKASCNQLNAADSI